ncbi:MAG: hypothetical protein JST00_12505 [Deltaproteobacteria bacterium]|nr:hypothetical protein [Deltaproteobacteria bacterium]
MRMYRAPGREADPEVIPAPPARALVSPTLWGLAAVALLAIPTAILNVVLVPDAHSSGRSVRLVPEVDTFEAVVALLVLGTFVVVVAQLVRRVAPQWSGLRPWQKGLYVVALLAAQSISIVGGEAALLESHGGLELFGPSLRSSHRGPSGARAHVMAGGLGCGLELFVAEPLSPTMHRVQRVSGHCGEGAQVRWRSDAPPILVDANDVPIVDGPTPRLWGWLGGC